MKIDLNKKFNYCWKNPRNGRLCYVAFEGLTVVRVEDVVKADEPRNTRLMSYDSVIREMLGLKQRSKRRNDILPFKAKQKEEYLVMLKCG
jgi:hypothetical protein